MGERFYIETLGCPKNQVDTDKLSGSMLAAGLSEVCRREDADLVVINTCAFIDSARRESVEAILAALQDRRAGSRVVVTGCLAARAGAELAAALPELDAVVDVGVPVHLPSPQRWRQSQAGSSGGMDLLELPRPPAAAPWAYVKIAEGCDRRCGFCAIPSFRGPQNSRQQAAILAEVERLAVQEVVLVAQDLASYGRDFGQPGAIVELVRAVAQRVARVRLLYLYPSSLSDELIETVIATGVPYFDLSLQHVSRPLLRKMRRYGKGDVFLERIAKIRALAPNASLRSSFILGYPGESEEDHDSLLAFIAAAQLDWAGFFTFSDEDGTYANSLGDKVPTALALERLREASALQDGITFARRRQLVGGTERVLVDRRGEARSHREAPEIDGLIRVPRQLDPGRFYDVRLESAAGTDLLAVVSEEQVADGATLAGAR